MKKTIKKIKNRNHKIVKLLISAVGIFSIANIIMVWNFIKILQNTPKMW